MGIRQKGFSLVEVLIGLGLAGGISLILLQQQETATKIQTKSNANQTINSAVDLVQTALANKAVCSRSLDGRRVGDSIPALVDAINNPADLSAPALATGNPNHVSVGQVFPGNVRVESMRIVAEGANDFVEVNFNPNPTRTKKIVGGANIAKRFPIRGEKDGAGRYRNCYSEAYNLVDTARQLACQELGGNWSVPLKKCVYQKVPLYHNTLTNTLTLTATQMSTEVQRGCSECRRECNPCQAGEYQAGGGCSLGSNCKIVHRWRNCNFTCKRDYGMTPKVGDILRNIP